MALTGFEPATPCFLLDLIEGKCSIQPELQGHVKFKRQHFLNLLLRACFALQKAQSCFSKLILINLFPFLSSTEELNLLIFILL